MPHLLSHARFFVRLDVLSDTAERRFKVRDDLLTADDEDQLSRARCIGPQLASRG